MDQSLIATKAFTYKGVALKIGDKFEAKAQDARTLIAIKKAEKAPPEEIKDDSKTKKVPNIASDKQSAIETKDLTVDGEEGVGDDTARAKRKYQRKDMEAET